MSDPNASLFVLTLLPGLGGALAMMPLAAVAILLRPSWRSRAPLRRFAYVALAVTALCVAALPAVLNLAGGWIASLLKAVAERPIPVIAGLAMIAFFAWRSLRAQGRGRFVYGGLAVLSYIAISGVAWLLPWVDSERVETQNVTALARGLDTPFHFLLSFPHYKPDRLGHDADIFSSWGELTLARTSRAQTTRAMVRQELLQRATEAGWRLAHNLDWVDAPSPEELTRLGITHPEDDLEIAQQLGGSEPTRYSCRVWISEAGNFVRAVWRVDTN